MCVARVNCVQDMVISSQFLNSMPRHKEQPTSSGLILRPSGNTHTHTHMNIRPAVLQARAETSGENRPVRYCALPRDVTPSVDTQSTR